MARIHKDRIVADINITPFTDVILVLLIIFMVTTPLIYQSNIKVNLPSAKSAASTDGKMVPQQASITITSEGMVYLDEGLVTQKELRAKVTQMFQDNPELSVYLRSDKLAKFKDIVQVLDLLTELGISKLDIAAMREENQVGGGL